MRNSIFAVTLAALLSTPLPAAEPDGPPIGTRLGKRAKPVEASNERAGAIAAHGMAYCLVHKHGKLIREILASVDPDAIARIDGGEVGDLYCSNRMLDSNHLVEGHRIVYPPDVMRGMLAEHLVKADRETYRRLQPLPRQRVYVRPWYAATQRHLAVDEMATCVADVDPTGTMAVLDTEVYCAAEQTALQALTPVMAPCLTAGAELQANRQALRSALAEALYQRAQSWPAVQVSQTQQTPGAAE